MDLCAIHDTTKLLNDDGALELFVCIIVALVAVVSCVRKTHIGCILVFFDSLHEYEAITTPSPMTGQAARRGESGCSSWKALPGPRSSAPSTSSSSCRSVPLRVDHRMSERHTQTGKIHDMCIYSFSYLRSIPQVVHGAAALGCCGGVLEVRVGCTSSQDTRHKLVASHLFGIILSRGPLFLSVSRGSYVVFCKTCLGAPLNAGSRLLTRRQFQFWRLSVHCCGMFGVFLPRSSFELLVQHIS